MSTSSANHCFAVADSGAAGVQERPQLPRPDESPPSAMTIGTSSRRQALLKSIAELETERRLAVGAVSAEDEEKRWLYGQIAALQRKIQQLQTGQVGDTPAENPEPPVAGSQARLERIDAELSGLRGQLEALSSSASSSDELADQEEGGGGGGPGGRRGGASERPSNGTAARGRSSADRPRSPLPAPAQAAGGESELVVSLLGLLRSADSALVTSTLLTMSAGAESGAALRQAGALPLLVQLVHRGAATGDGGRQGAPRPDRQLRAAAARALHNLVRSQPDGRRARREMRVLRLLEQLREFAESLWQQVDERGQPGLADDAADQHPVSAMVALMKLSFDDQQRAVLSRLGGLHGLAELLTAEHEAHGAHTDSPGCCSTRRFAGMALTNLTFGDGTNKALLCGLRPFLRALVAQLLSPSDDLVQVTASVMRNLSWRADPASKQALREAGAVPALTRAALRTAREPSLKSILSALWNLSAHCGLNKAAICAEEGALPFLVKTLTYDSPTKSPAVSENGGGILRNVSSHVAVCEEYRRVLRQHNCLQILLDQLKSPSLTIVSNACGTLWNLSARCAHDQRTLWELGAVSQLRALVHSKHQMIASASGAALQNLLSARPEAAAEPSSAPATPAEHDTSFHEEESDHPTDFSALYAEGREEDTVVFKKPPPPPPPPPMGRPSASCQLDEDTVHTYATEGTPYQAGTPYNFSTATSLLDLREPPSPGPPGSSAPASALETPLIFSRSSSVGSLSSFEGAAATGEQGSVISEYSRQVSGAVSPSDLPDSPSQMPGTPQPVRKQASAEPPPRAAKPAAAPPQKAVTTGVFEEAPRHFQQEGTPLGFSRATSLSSLTIDEPPLALPLPGPPPPDSDGPQQQPAAAVNGGDGSDGGGQRHSADSGSSDDGDDDMIYACIKSAMPTRKSHSVRSSRESGGGPALPPRGAASEPGRRAGSGRHQHPPPHAARRPAAAAAPAKSGSRSPGGGRLNGYPRLSPRSCGAGADSAADSRRHRPPPPLIERNESDSGSCGDDILEQMIQQTMNRKDDRSGLGDSPSRRAAGASSAHHGQSWSVKQYHRYTERQASGAARLARAGLPLPPPPPAAERPRQYAVEGTPVNFSRAESLSDLELEEAEPAERAAPPPPPPPAPAGDTPTVYATEGTPGVFSRADSLSDICAAVERPAGPDGRPSAATNGVDGHDWRLHSSGGDTDSETDDMLLERCISSAMPKTSRSDSAQRRRQRRRAHRRRRGAGSGDGEQWPQHQQLDHPLLPPAVAPKPRVVSDRAAAGATGRTPEPPPTNGDQSDTSAGDGAPKRKSVIITSL
ncbi:adenomatous polyposis coli protein-like [Amphibalanus amphitrite]|uniref:adenomatous polyposis coli protein-like n=1 Tax=Amphibalanus amphitrite TaxID=1232801 RepID=UPI001C902B5E|nr:adenomatous polyposis coli protein-like [Amphibalanus amphitrite]